MTNFEKVGLFMKTFGQEVKTVSGLSNEKINSLRNYGRSENNNYKCINLGKNAKGDELQAAFLISKLKNIDNIKEKRRNFRLGFVLY